MRWSIKKAGGTACFTRLISVERGAGVLASFVLSSLACFAASPADFGVAEFNAALEARNLKMRIKYDVSLEPPETFRIEPYAAGGAHITGGDLRGLMYGLLEGADQIRTTGRMKQTHSVPSIAIRAVRRFARDDVADWRTYFEMLARDRFNRFTLIYTAPPADLEKLKVVSQLAADYGVEFTLALWYEPDESIAKIVSACPALRMLQIRAPSKSVDRYAAYAFKPLREAGRRIALDPDPEITETASAEGVAIRSDVQAWPPNFDIEAPADFASHTEFYWLWGRLGYDPKSKPAHSEDADELKSAAQIVSLLAMARGGSNNWVALTADVTESAKLRPVDIGDALSIAAADVESSSILDLQLLAKIARDEATKQRSAVPAPAVPTEEAAPPLARPTFTHTVMHISAPDHPIELALQIAPIKDARVIRLHYRLLTVTATTVIEKPAALSVSFTIPPMTADFLYYFEIISRNDRGWFEPDPLTATPYHIVRIQIPPPPQQ